MGTIYTKTYLKKLAKTVSSRKEFRELYPGAYVAVYKKGYKKEVFGRLKKMRSYSIDFNFENLSDLKKEVLFRIKKMLNEDQIKTSEDLKRANPTLYHYYYKYKIYKIERVFCKKNTYSKSECRIAAKKCKSKAEFSERFRKLYVYSSRRVWFDEICFHMKKVRINYREQVCREIFEIFFGKTFESSRPEWLINPLTGYRLELDGFCPQLKLAFEYNGRIHYDKKHPNYEKTRKRDKIKRQVCKKNGITIITINAFKLEKKKSSADNKIRTYPQKKTNS